MRTFITFFTCFYASLALADWTSDFNALKNHPRSYEDTGAICEELARLKFERKFNNSNFEVLVGIAYGDVQNTIGELDIVVFDHSQEKVILVSEVKCWKNLQGGLAKAKDQRQRFLFNLNSNKNLYFESTSSQKQYKTEQFKFVTTFSTIGQKGAVNNGYDDELEYDLRELHTLRMEMLRCQDRKECAQPE